MHLYFKITDVDISVRLCLKHKAVWHSQIPVVFGRRGPFINKDVCAHLALLKELYLSDQDFSTKSFKCSPETASLSAPCLMLKYVPCLARPP